MSEIALLHVEEECKIKSESALMEAQEMKGAKETRKEPYLVIPKHAQGGLSGGNIIHAINTVARDIRFDIGRQNFKFRTVI